MHKWTSIALAAAMLALGGCGNGRAPENGNQGSPGNRVVNDFPPPPQTGPQEPQFGPEQAMTGIWTNRFEHSEFNGCWLSMTAESAADYRRLDPVNADAPLQERSYRLRIIGRRSVDPASGPALYGHLGGWRCEIQATRILAAEMIGGRGRPAPPEADRTPVDPEVERARKAAGADRPAFSEGHDRARLEDQRRNMPPAAG